MAKSTVNYFFSPDVQEFKPLILTLFDLIGRQFEVKFTEVANADTAQINFARSSPSYPINSEVYSALVSLLPCDETYIKGLHIYFDKDKLVLDPLASMFYILHCLSEKLVKETALDKYQRLTYEKSINNQYHQSSEDIVSPLIHLFLKRYVSIENISAVPRKQVILTHDIDFLTSGFKQELSYFLRKPSFQLAKHLIRHLITKKKIWNNLNEIIHIERSFGFKSTFYLLPVEGKYHDISNADYGRQILTTTAEHLLQNGMEVGLHKSSSDLSHEEEMKRFRLSYVKTNRNHYLKYNLPNDWIKIATSGIQVDTGLGWSDVAGLRNGYPLYFRPFVTDSSLIVVPLALMDTTFYNQGKTGLVETFKQMSEGWKDGYTVSVLFHNNFLTPWSNKYFLEQYRALLKYLHSGQIEVISTSDLALDPINTNQ